MRLERAGERRRRRREIHDHGAIQVEAVEIVDALIRNVEAVTGKDQRRVHFRTPDRFAG